MVLSREEAFKVLSLSSDAMEVEIKSAYRKLALQHHPDKCPPEEKETATKKFQEISLAHKKLTSTDAEVDRFEERFQDPEFIWILIRAMSTESDPFLWSDGSDEDFLDNDDESCYSFEEDEDGYCCNCGCYHRSGYQRSSASRREPTVQWNMRPPEEVEKLAQELIESEEREKRQANRKQEKRRNNRERRFKKRQEQTATAAALAKSAKQKVNAVKIKSKDNDGKKFESHLGDIAKQNGKGGEDRKAKDDKDSGFVGATRNSDGEVEEEEFDENSAFAARHAVAPKPQVTSAQQQQPQQQQPQHHQQYHAPPPQPPPPTMVRVPPLMSAPVPPQPPPPPPPPSPPRARPRQQPPQPPQTPPPPPTQSDAARRQAKEGNRLMAQSGDYAAALAQFGAAIQLDPTDCRYYGSRAVCHYQLGQLELCASDADMAVQLNSQYAKGFYTRGLAQSQLGRHAEAAASFGCVVALDAGGCGDALERMRECQLECLAALGFEERPLCLRALELSGGDLEAAANRLLADRPEPTSYANSVTCRPCPAAVLRTRNRSPAPSPPPPPPPQPVAKVAHPVAKAAQPPVAKAAQPPVAKAAQPPVANAAPMFAKQQRNSFRSGPLAPGGCPGNPYGAVSLWVGSVMPDVTEGLLFQEFGRFGSVVSVNLLRKTCCAFVNMQTPQDAANARAGLNGEILGSHQVEVKLQNKSARS